MSLEVPSRTLPAVNFGSSLGPSVIDQQAYTGRSAPVTSSQVAPPSTMSIWKSARQ